MLGRGPTFPDFFRRGIDRRRHTVRLPLLAHLFARPSMRQRGIKSCNMGFWRDDLLRLNGFNEAMTGWGREDTELAVRAFHAGLLRRSEEHTSELQSLMRISYAVFCLKKKNVQHTLTIISIHIYNHTNRHR